MLKRNHARLALALTGAAVLCSPAALLAGEKGQMSGDHDHHAMMANAGFDTNEFTTAPLRADVLVRVDGSREEVFNLINNFERMPEWMPGLHAVAVDNSMAASPNGEGCVRTCSFPFGDVSEKIVYNDGWRRLAYSMTDDNTLGYSNHLAVVTVFEDGDVTLVSWQYYFDHASAEQEGAKLQKGASMVLARIGDLLEKDRGDDA
jgi:uncharacterized protein YndB with AHSA1/START domain